MKLNPNNCNNCEYYEWYNGVCFNGDSPNCADFMDSNDTCKHFVPHKGLNYSAMNTTYEFIDNRFNKQS